MKFNKSVNGELFVEILDKRQESLQEQQTESGIYMAPKQGLPVLRRAKILSEPIPDSPFKKEDTVLIRQQAGMEVEVQGEKRTMIKNSDIMFRD